MQPERGRNFTEEEDRNGGPSVAIISHGLWHKGFGGAGDIIGKQIQVNAASTTVVGVMPANFVFPPGSNDQVELLVPFQFDPANPGSRGSHFLSAIGRLKPGVTTEQAMSEMTSLMAGWSSESRAQHLLGFPNHPVIMLSLHEDVVGSARKAVWLLMAAVGFVLLIACVNVANLMLARATARQKEFALRAALGASRWRIVRQLLIESLLLAVAGGALGFALSLWALNLLLNAIPVQLPFWMDFGIDLRVLVFTLGITLLTGLIFGAVPALQTSRVDLNDTRVRATIFAVAVLTPVNLLIVSAAAYKGLEAMDSVSFCGQVCHTPMHPQFSAWQAGVHARVACVECHIGEGASWFVKSKLSGVRQVFAVMLNTYSRPIPTPVHDLRPARETCEACHWPGKFGGYRLRVLTKFGEDDQNTATKTVLLMRIGGGDMVAGIHGVPLGAVVVIEYLSDPARQNIPWVRYTNGQNHAEYAIKDIKREDQGKLERVLMEGENGTLLASDDAIELELAAPGGGHRPSLV